MLWELADNPFDMARQSVEDVREIIRPCGLSPQSKAIVKLSQILVDEHDGEVPANQDALEQLPGVGHKTAAVVMAQSFGVPSFPVDTHIHRPLSAGPHQRQECGTNRKDLNACSRKSVGTSCIYRLFFTP